MSAEIKDWLEALGLGKYGDAFVENEVELRSLPHLDQDDLKELGVALGHRKLMLSAIRELTAVSTPPASASPGDAATMSTAPGGDGERRWLTIMFCDLVDSTALAGRLDPEIMREVLRHYQDRCAGEISRFDGFVAKFMGDGILAYFGYPKAHEDSAERAVQAGLAILDAMRGTATPDGQPLGVRIGIATGLVVVGDLVGEGSSQEEAVVGETPNLAARLQGLAAPGQLVIAEATRRLLGVNFELEDLGRRQLKGIDEPTTAYAVVGVRTSASRFDSRTGAALSQLVGRDQELALLLERWTQAKGGEGQGVLLVGEAGIGKSRITRALFDGIEAESHLRIRYQCSPYHGDSALWPVIQQLERAAKFTGTDTGEAKLDKLEALLAQAGNADEASPLIAELIGLDGEGRYGPMDMIPRVQRQRTLDALVVQLLGLASGMPVLMVLEDAHWIDPTTLEFIELCLEGISAAPVLLLLTSRPDNQPSLAGHPHVTRLTLNRLGRQGIEAIVAGLGGDALPADAVGEIVARTDGVPLFIEELTKAILESGETTIPTSLHDSLMARLDRIPEVKEVAQVAACIGREFHHSLLSTIAEASEQDLRRSLDKLAEVELIFRRGAPPDAHYTFKHALVRDAAYQSLLKSRRQNVHGRIADALDVSSSTSAGAEPEILARHLELADRVAESIAQWQIAGTHANRRFAYREAIGHLENGLRLLKTSTGDPERDGHELMLRRALGPALINARGWSTDEVKTNYDRAQRLCQALGNEEALFEVLRGLWQFHLTRTDLAQCLALGKQMLDQAHRAPGEGRELDADYALGATYIWRGEFEHAREHFEAGRKRYERQGDTGAGDKSGHSAGVVCLYLGAQTFWCLGYPDRARALIEEARDLAARLSLPFSIAISTLQSAFTQLHCRNPGQTAELAEEGYRVAAEYGFPALSAELDIVRGWAAAMSGRLSEGMAQMQLGLDAFAEMGLLLQRPCYQILMAEMHIECGAIDAAENALDEAGALARETAEGYAEAEWHRVAAKLHIARNNDVAAAVASLRDALRIAQAQGAKSWQIRAAKDLARLWANRGQRQEAVALLAPIYGWFTEGLDTPDLEEAKALLDELA